MSASQVLNPTPTVEVLCADKDNLGEGPFFEQETNQLLWVDIESKTINFFNIETSKKRSIKVPDRVGAVIPVEGSPNLLASIGRKLCIVDRETGAIIEELVCVEDDKPNNRFNDAKCDANSRLWAGTMSLTAEKNKGNLYSYYEDNLTLRVPKVTISNGLGWSMDNSTMYYIDSTPNSVYSFDYNLTNGTICNQKILIDFSQHGNIGSPDGMCTDIEGRLWIASFYGGFITCWDGRTGKMLVKIKIPGANNVTSCCFGGPDYSWLYVTSALIDVPDPSAEPNAGNVFVIKNLGTKGLPANRFKKHVS